MQCDREHFVDRTCASFKIRQFCCRQATKPQNYLVKVYQNKSYWYFATTTSEATSINTCTFFLPAHNRRHSSTHALQNSQKITPKAVDCSDEIGLDPKSQTLIPCVHGLNEMEKIEELVAMAAMKSMGVGERRRMMRELTGLAGIRPTAVAAFRRTAGYG